MYRLLLMMLSVICIGCTNDVEEVRRQTRDTLFPVSSTRNVEMLYSDSARLRSRIRAPQRDTYLGEKEYVEFPEGLQVLFYESDGSEGGQLKARYAISYTKQDKMIARNDVQLWNKEGKKLNTEELIWDQKSGRIYSEKFSKITSAEEVIYGDGFESNQDFSSYRIVKIRGIVTLKE